MSDLFSGVVIITVIVVALVIIWLVIVKAGRERKDYERGLKMVPMLIHLPPSTDDIEGGGRDERDVINETISEAQVMYSIIASTAVKGFKSKVYGQRHMAFEIVAHDGFIKYYAVVPAVLTETIKQAIAAAYPTARLEEVEDANFFNEEGKIAGTVGGELILKEDYWYPIATYEESKRDASLALLNAMSVAKKGDGIALQILFRPADEVWTKKSLERVQRMKEGKKTRRRSNNLLERAVMGVGYLAVDVAEALWKPPETREKEKSEEKVLTNLEQEEVQRIEEKTKYPGFETLVRIVASSATKARSEVLLGGVVAIFSQFDLPNNNGFRYDALKDIEGLSRDYVLRLFPQDDDSNILNSVEMATLFHLPAQNAIPTSQVERQLTKQVDGPAKLVEDGVLLGINEFRGEQKEIRLAEDDRRRHVYVIGSTGSGKSVFMMNVAYQDMMDGRGFAFIDPHGDAVEMLMSKVPPERIDDVIYFDPGDVENPIGMNMFEFTDPEQKDFIVQEGINMLQSLYDPGNQGFFGPRAHHMFRNAALLLMSSPEGATFIDIPRCFIDPEFVKAKLKHVTDKTVYDYWTKEFPASQRSNDAGEVITWFVSKWGPFLSNQMMRNILGQEKSGFNIREVMDGKKILLVNLSKGKMGELNSKLLGMIFVMKFQTAAMSRADTLEDQRTDFCLFVDEFQNFSTESFSTILSEARKYRLNLVLANQFMTQLTDQIREGVLGNVGTIMSGRLGVTDAELMEKAFTPVFNAEDLHKLANYSVIATVMMFSVPSAPFTMKLLPPMGDSNAELLKTLRVYSATKYGRTRVEVDREINARLAAPDDSAARPASSNAPNTAPSVAPDSLDNQDTKVARPGGTTAPPPPPKNFLDSWLEKKAALEDEQRQKMVAETTKIIETEVPVIKEPAKAKKSAALIGSLESGVKIEHDTTVREPEVAMSPPAEDAKAQSEPGETVIKLR